MYALGLEQAGHEVIGFCEVDKFCQKLLKKHWPTKPISSSIEYLNKRLMELLEDGPARISAALDKGRGYSGTPPELPQPVQDLYGRWLIPFAWLDLHSGSWKTWQHCLISSWETYSKPWPPSGMMLNGIAYQREPLAHPTIAPEHTFLPTMGATEGKGTSRARFKGSPNFKASRMSEALRKSWECPAYLNPSFAEVMFGLPKDFTLLETETLPASSENSQRD